MAENRRRLKHSDYTVGWICASPKTELAAAAAMLDYQHPILPAADPKDTNSYLLGSIDNHNVVIACLPAETAGKVSAAMVAKDMIRSFQAIRFGLMVGTGGGAPYYGTNGNNGAEDWGSEDEVSEEEYLESIRDIRLGDVVISLQSKPSDAVVQYDFGESMQEREFIHLGGHKISEMVSKMLSDNPAMATKFQYPGSAKDRLFKSDVVHIDENKSCEACCGPFDANLVKRKDRYGIAPRIHYGTIGSADQEMKDATLRDRWSQKEKIICFEMEAAGES
ncbi:hypothetical protein ABW20_dc0109347 [Dactylellina cionopaga]|nr:hypothetical protein ABW20_dc0109347 [Dactylellina cionopaga]